MPILSSVLAWPDAFAVYGVLGVLLGVTCLMQVSTMLGPESEEVPGKLDDDLQIQVTTARVTAADQSHTGRWAEYATLIWAHSVIGWGFFLFQNWIPTFLQHMHVTNPVTRGLLSAMPWVAPAVLAFVFRAFFEHLRNKGMAAHKSQTIAHTTACLGAAAALTPLAMFESVTPALGLFCIGITLAVQACNYSGFHAYVQHCFADKAGSVLGVTNSCGVVAGMGANMAMGFTLSSTGSYQIMFAITAVLYASSWLFWYATLHRKKAVAL
jgi:nitrate/nitrite transporter NarK